MPPPKVVTGKMLKCYACLDHKDIHHFDIKCYNDKGEPITWKRCIVCTSKAKEEKEAKKATKLQTEKGKKSTTKEEDDELTRKCRKCKQIKDLKEFPLKKQGGHYVDCKICKGL